MEPGGTRHEIPWRAAKLGSLRLHSRCRAVAVGDVQLVVARSSASYASCHSLARARCSCRSAASGTRRHSVALDGARWHELWRSAALCSARVALSGARRRFAAHGGAQRHAVERGGRRQAASRGDTARWRSVARRCVHLVALSGIRWRSAALARAAVSAHLKNRLAGLLQRSSADQR